MVRFAMALAVALAVGQPALAQQHVHGGETGASVDELITIARRLNPDLQVAALEADAAAARVEGAGSLADPKLQVTIDDWRRNDPGYLPRPDWNQATKKVTLSQELPFWGKRDLRREVAEANSRKASLMRRQVENELVAKVKTAYAQYHAAHLAGDLARDLRGRLDTLSRLARTRYAQGSGKQQDATRAEVEKAMLEAEIVRTDGERRRARVAINRLLARPLDAALVEAPAPRQIPAPEALDLGALTERAQQQNPEILVEAATIEGSDKSVRLAEKSWYPDFEVGFGAFRQEDRFAGYEAMVQFNIPLQWGLRNAEIGEAKAMAAAARARRESRTLDIANQVADAWIALRTSRDVERILRESQLPQAEIGFQAAARSYELGRTELVDVLMTEQQLWKANIDLIRIVFDQQTQFAELERLVAGEL